MKIYILKHRQDFVGYNCSLRTRLIASSRSPNPNARLAWVGKLVYSSQRSLHLWALHVVEMKYLLLDMLYCAISFPVSLFSDKSILWANFMQVFSSKARCNGILSGWLEYAGNCCGFDQYVLLTEEMQIQPLFWHHVELLVNNHC